MHQKVPGTLSQPVTIGYICIFQVMIFLLHFLGVLSILKLVSRGLKII